VPHLIERAAARLLEDDSGKDEANPLVPEGPAAYTVTEPGPPGHVVSVEDMEKAGLLLRLAQHSETAKEIWQVQRQLLRTAFPVDAIPPASAAPLNLLMVTSSRPAEGKSFTSLNLSASIARQGDHPVLLIDADVKQSSLTQILRLSEAPGLLNCLGPQGPRARSVIHRTEIPGLSFLPRGAEEEVTPNPFARRMVTELLHDLAHEDPERVIIVDIAPALVRGDSSALASVVGQVLVIVEAERTQRQEVETTLDLVQECATVSLMLNKTKGPSRAMQLRAKSYGYGYGY
jgi:receptor protein-tyrosine kinase